MRLTLHTDYSLRLLMMLSARPDERLTIQDIADANAISKNHLMKVAQDLGRAGFIRTIRGKGGGLVLARPASEIGLGDVVRAMEPDFSIVECMPPRASKCRLIPACRLNAYLADAAQAFQSELDRHTLADLLADPEEVSALLAS